jgi:hypothetical protein
MQAHFRQVPLSVGSHDRVLSDLQRRRYQYWRSAEEQTATKTMTIVMMTTMLMLMLVMATNPVVVVVLTMPMPTLRVPEGLMLGPEGMVLQTVAVENVRVE